MSVIDHFVLSNRRTVWCTYVWEMDGKRADKISHVLARPGDELLQLLLYVVIQNWSYFSRRFLYPRTPYKRLQFGLTAVYLR